MNISNRTINVAGGKFLYKKGPNYLNDNRDNGTYNLKINIYL